MSQDSIYARLGIRPIINAAGTFTEWGGSLMPEEVVRAWCAASREFVDLRALQDRIGQRIANLLQVEAAMVTSGAASGLLLATAAVISQRDSRFLQPEGLAKEKNRFRVLRQRSHRDVYDRQVAMAGVEIVDVENGDDVARAIDGQTILMLAYNVHEPGGSLDHTRWIELARHHGLPTLLDAAADVPPAHHLGHYLRLGYDLVVFSGGKAIRGPQDTGLLLGRHDLIEAAKRNASPNEGVVGRVSKVPKEDLVACWAAVERFVDLDPLQLETDCRRRLQMVEASLRDLPHVSTESVTPACPANGFPHLIVDWNQEERTISWKRMQQNLREGDPSIVTGRVAGTGERGVLISAINLSDDQAVTVGHRIRDELMAAQA